MTTMNRWRRTATWAVLVSFALCSSGCASWHAGNTRDGRAQRASSQADSTEAREAMLGHQEKIDDANDGVLILAIGAILAGSLGWSAQRGADVPNVGDLRQRHRVTEAAWLCLGATGILTLILQ